MNTYYCLDRQLLYLEEVWRNKRIRNAEIVLENYICIAL